MDPREDPCRPETAGVAKDVVSGAHALAAARVAQQAYVSEIQRALQAHPETSGCAAEPVPFTQPLQVSKHQSPARQVQAPVARHARRGVDTAVRVDRHHNVSPRSQPVSQIFITGMARDDNVSWGTGAGESIGDIVVDTPRNSTDKVSAGRVIAVQEYEQRVGAFVQIRRPIDAGPQFRGSDRQNVRIERGRKLVFRIAGGQRAPAGRVRRYLSEC